MDDTTVYQCPECNFNADNIEELDSHMMDHHSNEASQRSNAGGVVHHHHHRHNGHHHSHPSHHHHHRQPAHSRHYDEQSADMHRHHGQHHGHSRPPLNNHHHHHNGYHHGNGTHSHEASYEEDEDFFNDKPEHYENNEDEMDDYYNGHHNQYSSHHQHHYKNHNENAHKYAAKVTSSARPPQSVVVASNHSSVSNSPLKMSNSHSSVSGQQPVINSDNHYERQYACQRCNFFTNNPRAILYHRKEYHMEKINVHECLYCQYASQYSGKVERHTLLRHKIDIQNNMNSSLNATGKTPGTPAGLAKTPSGLNMSQHQPGLNEQDLVIDDDQVGSSAINLVPNFQCHLCPCKYKRSNDLTKHLRLKHQILNASSGVPTPNEQENGDYADDAHDDIDPVSQHSPSNLKPTPPPSSSTSTASSTISSSSAASIKAAADALKSGLLECPYCVYKVQAIQSSEYLNHVREHLAGKMFRCVLCNSVYKYRGDCVVHLKRKHQSADMQAHNYVDKFELDQIDPHAVYSLLKPKQGEEYGEGVNGEQQEKLFGCAYCDYKANYKGDVYKHQTRRHPGLAKMINPLGGANGSFSLNQSSSSLLPGNSATGASNGYSRHPSGSMNGLHGDSASNYDDEEEYLDEMNNHNDEEGIMNGGDDANYEDDQPGYGRGEYDDEVGDMHEMDEEYEEEMYNQHHMMENGEYDEEDDFFNERGGQNEEPQVGSQSNGGHYGATSNTSLNASQSQYVNRFQCNFCSFSAASHAKLQSHLAIHYNLKPFMCPICKRRANFKWDIQKHMRKIHNDHTSEVICLSEKEARESISSYMGSVPSSSYGVSGSPGANRIVYDNTNRVLQSVNNGQSPFKEGSPSKHGATPNSSVLAENESMNQSGMPLLLKEKRFRCSLCTRVNSRWQYDVKKHIRNVHKGEGEIIMVEVEVDPERYQKYQRNGALLLPSGSTATPPPMINNAPHSNPSSQSHLSTGNPSHTLTPNGGATRSSTSLNGNVQSPAPAIPPHFAANLLANGGLISSTHLQYLNSPNNTDASGNKKFLCSLCPYRSNWKADMYRHLRKRHDMPTPNSDDMRVLSPEEAASTIEEYEHKFGQTVRKRAREPLNTTARDSLSLTTMMSHPSEEVLSSKRFKSVAINDSSSVQSSSANTAASQDEEDLADEDLVDTKAGGVDRLPVSIAELNIKPYKCLKCGFRSDRKSDTLRHIRIKHDLEALQAYKFLKIMSIKDASDTIQEYEATRTSRKSVGGNTTVNAGVASAVSMLGAGVGPIGFNPKASLPLNLATALAAKLPIIQPPVSTTLAQTSQTPSNQPRVTINIKMPQPPAQKENKNEEKMDQIRTSQEFFKCPFCIFKHMSRMVMRKHLSTHFYGNSLREAPIYQCNQCSYRSDWQYAVKRHIVTSHLGSGTQAQCVKLTYTQQNSGAAQSQIDMDEKHRRLIWLKKRRRFLKRQRAKNFASAKNVVLVDKTNTTDEKKQAKATTDNANENELVDKKRENQDTTLINGNYDQDSQYEQEQSEDQQMEDMLEDDYYDEELDYDGDEDLMNQNENSRTDYSHSNTSSIASRPASSHHHHHSKLMHHNTNPTNTPSSENTDDQYDEPSSMIIDSDHSTKHIESINLTDHDGKDFTVSYYVANATVPCPVNGMMLPGQSGANGAVSMIKKKTYFCQSCPYKTNNYCNLKQHLLLHRFKEGCYKCRYCSYYVGMIRLLKQHEVIHPEYEPRDETYPPPRLANNSMSNPSSNNNNNASFNSFVKQEQLIN